MFTQLLEAKNNFTVEINSRVYERMPGFTEEFLKHCRSKRIKILKDNFDSLYSENDTDPRVKDSIEKLMGKTKQFVLNKLYADYYNRVKKLEDLYKVGIKIINHRC